MGPGTLITDNGIAIATQVGEVFSQTNPSYEDLWDAGILQWQGGNTGSFSDVFSVSGMAGGTDYTLTAIPEPASMILAAMGLLGLAGWRRSRR
jgi:hypothetical protein